MMVKGLLLWRMRFLSTLSYSIFDVKVSLVDFLIQEPII